MVTKILCVCYAQQQKNSKLLNQMQNNTEKERETEKDVEKSHRQSAKLQQNQMKHVREFAFDLTKRYI